MTAQSNRGRVLVTGFGRFPGAAFNPTGPLVRRLARLCRPAFDDVGLVGHVFPTSYRAVDQDLPALLARYKPAAVVMFGLAARTRQVRIETTARNGYSRFPDVTRFTPSGRAIVPGGVARMRTNLSSMRLLHAARLHGRDVVLSRDAGRYLCNYLYWRVLERSRKPGGPLAIFVHVPQPQSPFTPSARIRRRTMTARELAAISEAIAACVVATARGRH